MNNTRIVNTTITTTPTEAATAAEIIVFEFVSCAIIMFVAIGAISLREVVADVDCLELLEPEICVV